MPVLCCNARRRKDKSEANSPDSQYKKGLFGLMFAKIDEFESLTPLMTTPESTDDSTPSNKVSMIPVDQSPPLPRRLSAGKTFIVPLATSRGFLERSPAVAVLDPPDGRVNSGDGTTKSCATIPEDDETAYTPTEAVRVDGDLISIDRTSASCMETRTNRYYSRTAIPMPTATPAFEIPTPLYAPPPPPDRFRPMLFVRSPKNFTRRDFHPVDTNPIINNNNDISNNYSNMRKSSTCDSITSFSSPDESSYGTNSPLDTSNSISDNVYFPADADFETETKPKFVEEG
ncbi:unnamed protein product [Enterobius vermicularis]|uniref:Uncharacterized protein n=1 Tax=Enterobius vermicularis TaxID=51028 RepID=A0A0N4VH34_ENTVE|nr:unnamed protein product [Enterobius vermicularis]